MKKFSKEEIDSTRKSFANKFPLAVAKIGGRNIEYFVMPSNLTDLPNFVYRMTGDPSNGHLIGCSEEIPEKFKPYFVLEEYIEFMEKGFDAKNRVIESEKEVLNLVPENLKPEYVKIRRDFFKTLLEKSKKNPEMYLFSKSDVKEFGKNLDMLENMVKDYSN